MTKIHISSGIFKKQRGRVVDRSTKCDGKRQKISLKSAQNVKIFYQYIV